MQLVGNTQLVEGDSKTLESLYALLRKNDIEPEGNPDVYIQLYKSFGADDARELSARATARAFGSASSSPGIRSARRVFIIVAPGMTSEAQNALLKTIEEPSGDALFFIIVPSPQMLLPTLRSRAQMLQLGAEREFLVEPADFLNAKPEKRLDMLKPLLDKDDDDRRDIGSLISFLAGLEEALSRDVEKNQAKLEAVYRARKYIGDKGSLVKALLEQVALIS